MMILALVAVLVTPVTASASDDEPRLLAHHQADAIVARGRVFLVTDSVALGAVDELGALLPDRTYTAIGYPGFHVWAAPDLLDDFPPRIKDTVIIALGNNEFDSSRAAIDAWIDEVMGVLEHTTQVIWVRPRRWSSGMYLWNDALTDADRRHSNLELADWPRTAHGHSEYIYSDGIHLRLAGQWAMARLLDDHIRGRAQLPGRGIRSSLAPVRSLPRGVKVKGWALDLDTTGPVNVRVRINNKTAAEARADIARPDVAAAWDRGPNHGFEVLVPRVADGRHVVCVEAWYGTDERWVEVGCQTIAVAHSPIASAAMTRTASRLRVRGWAFDPDRTDRPVRIRVTADGQKVGGRLADGKRLDVAAKFEIDPHHGFRLTVVLPPGADKVCAWALDRPRSRNTRLGCIFP